MEKILVFDTETTGLVPKKANYKEDFDVFPFVVEIAWYFEGTMKNYIIKPDGYEIPLEATEIHGISTEKALKEGKPFEKVMDEFLEDCFYANTLVGANLYFDTSIMKANLLRDGLVELYNYSYYALHKTKRVDILRKTIKLCGLKQANRNSPKIPSLSELYYELFGTSFDAHSAKNDVDATLLCYNELIELEII